MIVQLWQVFKDDEKVFEGDIYEVAEFCELTISAINYVRRHKTKTRQGYTIIKGESAHQIYEYDVYKNDRLLFIGTKVEASKYVGCDKNRIAEYADTRMEINEFTVKRKVVAVKDFEENKLKINKHKYNKKFDYLLRMLRLYGNTILSRTSESELLTHIENLKQEDIYVKYRKVIDKDDGDYWVIEEVKDDKK